ncbi:MAG: hypothetical protein IRZ04_21020 [Rhodospirillales bacterium]|nr:hypothetical protein [Rhodospirillales bacterium]
MAAAQSTTDHDFIRKWVEERGGRPAHVKTVAGKGEIGILRIDFPEPPDDNDASDANLEPISWDEFFQKFDENGLAFLYQEDSNFNKLVKRETAEAGKGGKSKKK